MSREKAQASRETAGIRAVQVGFADRYKVGLWTPMEVTIRGGSRSETGRVRASLSDSDGLNCSFDAADLPGVSRRGHQSSGLRPLRQ